MTFKAGHHSPRTPAAALAVAEGKVQRATTTGGVAPISLLLKKYRLEAQLPQNVLAERIGVTEPYVCYTETGKRPITFQMLIRWHKALRRNIAIETVVSWLVSRRGIMLQVGKEPWRQQLAARLCLAWPNMTAPTAEALSEILDRSILLKE